MKQKFFIFFGVIIVIVLLVVLNAISYVQREEEADNEVRPNRSTYNTGATGTRAFYDLLSETGRRVTRWQEPPSQLLNYGQNAPSVFVIIGKTRREIDETEAKQILDWTAGGGILVLIDREPPKNLIATTANWRLSLVFPSDALSFEIDPANPNQMTDKTTAAKPVQPSIFTSGINAVQPSRFAGTVNFERFADAEVNLPKFNTHPELIEKDTGFSVNTNTNFENENAQDDSLFRLTQPPPPKPAAENESEAGDAEDEEPTANPSHIAPVVHLSNGEKNILVDVPFGSGRIIFLTDPFIVSNGGINLVDNSQIGINIVASTGGIIAFDEYHQGFGVNDNRLLQYFAGTPVLPILGQIVLLVALIFFSQSRRFARPLPLDEPDRLSKLEYVAAMAQLQQRTKGYDLAIENIYTDFRRRVSRLLGVDNQSTSRKDFARLLSERLNRDELEIYNLMRKCEDIIHGEPTNKKTVLNVISDLREIEETLGLRRTGRKI